MVTISPLQLQLMTGFYHGVLTPSEWATMLLDVLGITPQSNNVTNITQWMHLEEPTVVASFANSNPLNVGSTSYPNIETGLFNTAATLQQSNMGGILSALSSNAPWSTFSQALVASPWSANHYGGSAAAIANTPAQSGSAPVASGLATSPTPGAGPVGSAAPGGLSSTGSGGILGALGSIGHTFSDLTNPVLWRNLGLIIGGGVLVILGTYVFLKSTADTEGSQS